MSEERVRMQIEGLIGRVSRETWDDFCRFELLFRRWSETINLAATGTLESFWQRHILDSLQLWPLALGARKWADLGSGGGFPGLIIAILLKTAPDASIELIESNRRKAAFLRTAVNELALPARVHAARIEDTVPRLAPPQIVTARALASLSELLRLAEPWLSASSRALFHKGRDYRKELAESAQHWDFDLVEHPSVVANDSIILEISKLRRRS